MIPVMAVFFLSAVATVLTLYTVVKPPDAYYHQEKGHSLATANYPSLALASSRYRMAFFLMHCSINPHANDVIRCNMPANGKRQMDRPRPDNRVMSESAKLL